MDPIGKPILNHKISCEFNFFFSRSGQRSQKERWHGCLHLKLANERNKMAYWTAWVNSLPLSLAVSLILPRTGFLVSFNEKTWPLSSRIYCYSLGHGINSQKDWSALILFEWASFNYCGHLLINTMKKSIQSFLLGLCSLSRKLSLLSLFEARLASLIKPA
jgi:hypothetical protein